MRRRLPMNGLFGVASVDERCLDPRAAESLARPLGFHEPTVQAEHAVVYTAGWAANYRSPDGLSVAGAAHLVSGGALGPRPSASAALECAATLYRTHGLDAFAQLQGQFCLAVCDPKARRLVLATDRFATRVIYYAEREGQVVFSSRLAWFRAEHRARLDHQALAEYLLYTAVPHPRTPFASIRKVPPGHLLIADASGVRTVPYWDMSYPEERNGGRATKWVRRLRIEIEAAVERYVAAEHSAGTIGAFLSGGTDSSTIAGMMTKLTGAPAKAFSIGYAESGYDELAYARTAAKWFGLAHREHCLTPAEAFRLLPAVVRYYEEPLGNSSALPTYACARLAHASGVRVLFAGDGGDELFGGNERYRTDAIFGLYNRVPPAVRHYVSDPLLGRLPDALPLLRRAHRYVRRSNIPNPRRFFSYHLLLTEPLSELLAEDFLAKVDAEQLLERAESYFQHLPPGTSELNRLLYLDLKLAIADNDVRKVSGMAELAGVEVRYPLLDARLAEFSGRMPSAFKVRGLEKRYLFKRALADFLPPAILKKPKHGFGAPIGGWMKHDRAWREFVSDLLHDRRTRERGYLLPSVLDDLWNRHQTEESSYYGDMLWPILMLELWHREHGEEKGNG